MADIIQDLADDLLARIETLTEIKGGPLYLYDVEDMLFEKGRKLFKTPGVAIIYNSGVGTDKGRSGDLAFDIYVCAGRDRQDRVNRSVKQIGTSILSQIRSLIMGEECNKTPAGRNWVWVLERPVEIDENLIIYLQRWRTRVITLN